MERERKKNKKTQTVNNQEVNYEVRGFVLPRVTHCAHSLVHGDSAWVLRCTITIVLYRGIPESMTPETSTCAHCYIPVSSRHACTLTALTASTRGSVRSEHPTPAPKYKRPTIIHILHSILRPIFTSLLSVYMHVPVCMEAVEKL